jgi:hypothetical protein
MKKITKKEFIALHKSGKLKLIQGYTQMPKNEILDILNDITDISEYFKPVSNYGNLASDKSGMVTVTIYKHNQFIFVETIVDNSKNPECSWNETEVFNTIYYMEI